MDDIYLSSTSPDGSHQCIIDGDGQRVWMYLHDVEKNRVISEAPVCSLIEPISYDDFKKTYRAGDTPPFVEGYVSDRALIPDIDASRLAIQWLDDGVSVIASVDGEPFTMITKKRGYSKAISQSGPWGHPWDEDAIRGRYSK